ncbi:MULTISPECIES: ribokinase [unclassified Paenibacillus]|uniref:ribokinase n=1 Tax=unclassified Paenibacillus TaxID=185978 RepID=UPI001B77D508|nr:MULTISPECIES: ribokinase [unclassified Paenibacillus]MBP1153792.1 ribokinase [Paenibacillus sp. PvP091]MBP1170823.1 ribokinase [Paenibacillus sp. PvR098]MBP2441851.1 ribokinase [Paenibacillus sp. PvP052]
MKQPKIAIVGSLNMDIIVSMERMPHAGETVTAQHVSYLPGGKGANQAVGCAKLGADVSMIGAVGQDVFGKQIVGKFQELGIATNRLEQLEDAPTGIASIYHTREDNCIAVVPGANALCTPDLVFAHAQAIREARLLLVQLEVPLPTVQHALELARETGITTVLNPAPARVLPSELLALADWITPNESEFALLSGGNPGSEAEWETALRDFQTAAGPAVIVTRGQAGCSYLDDSGRIRTVPAPTVQVVDTTGAGDAFNAALCCGLASGWAFDETVSFAIHAASLSVTRFGAQDGMPTMEEVRSSMETEG